MAISQSRVFDHYFASGLSGYTPDSGGNSYDYTPQQGSIPGPVLIRRQPYQCSYGTAIVIPYYAVEGAGEIWQYWSLFHPRLTLSGTTTEAYRIRIWAKVRAVYSTFNAHTANACAADVRLDVYTLATPGGQGVVHKVHPDEGWVTLSVIATGNLVAGAKTLYANIMRGEETEDVIPKDPMLLLDSWGYEIE